MAGVCLSSIKKRPENGCILNLRGLGPWQTAIVLSIPVFDVAMRWEKGELIAHIRGRLRILVAFLATIGVGLATMFAVAVPGHAAEEAWEADYSYRGELTRYGVAPGEWRALVWAGAAAGVTDPYPRVGSEFSDMGWAWCVDYGAKNPGVDSDAVYSTSNVEKMTFSDANQRNAAIAVASKLEAAFEAGDAAAASKYAAFQQALIGTQVGAEQVLAGIYGHNNDSATSDLGKLGGTSDEFETLTGYKRGANGRLVFDHAIESAPADAYILVVQARKDTATGRLLSPARNQRVTPVDQPGLNNEPAPSTTPTPTATAVPEPTPGTGEPTTQPSETEPSDETPTTSEEVTPEASTTTETVTTTASTTVEVPTTVVTTETTTEISSVITTVTPEPTTVT